MTNLTIEDLHQCEVTVHIIKKISIDGVLTVLEKDGMCSLVFPGGVYRFYTYQIVSIPPVEGYLPTIGLMSRTEFYFDDAYLESIAGQLVEIIVDGPGAEVKTFNMLGTLRADSGGFYRVIRDDAGAIKFQLADVVRIQTAGEYPKIYLRSNFL